VTGPARRLALGLALAALSSAPGIALHATPATAALPKTSQYERWRDRVAEARAEVERAHERRDTAEKAVDRMRHSHHPRGAAREALLAEREEARAGVTGAEKALEDLLEQARRAGVPPGWLRAPDQAPAATQE